MKKYTIFFKKIFYIFFKLVNFYYYYFRIKKIKFKRYNTMDERTFIMVKPDGV